MDPALRGRLVEQTHGDAPVLLELLDIRRRLIERTEGELDRLLGGLVAQTTLLVLTQTLLRTFGMRHVVSLQGPRTHRPGRLGGNRFCSGVGAIDKRMVAVFLSCVPWPRL